METISWLGLDATPVMTGTFTEEDGVVVIEWDIDPAFLFRTARYRKVEVEAFVRLGLMEVKDETTHN